MTLTGAASGNYTVSQPALTANITAKGLTVTGAVASNKVYDGALTATITGGSLVGVVGADVVALATATSGTFATATVANGKTVTSGMTITGAASGNYTVAQPVLTANITAKELTVTGAAASNKVYDGALTATITGGSLVGKVGADVVTLATATSGTFASADVANGIVVTPAMTLTGAASGNYILEQPSLSADITPKPLTVTGATAVNKTFDGELTAGISGGTLVGVLGPDDVNLATFTSGTFADKNVASNITVTSAMTLTGANADNYSIVQPTLSANILAKELTVTDAVVAAKIYDGNKDATITGATLSGIVPGYNVALETATAGIFASANIGAGIAVTPAMTITGGQAANYALTQPVLTGDITAKELTVSGAVADNKVYDGNTDAVISGAALVGVVENEDVQLDALVGAFADKNVADALVVDPGLTLKGADIANYILAQPIGLTANITAKELTVTGAVAQNKVYDGNTDAVVSDAVLVGVEGADDVELDALVGAFASKTVADAVAVAPALTLKGAGIANYTLTQPVGLAANITARELTVAGAVAQNKTYDGSTDAVIGDASLVGLVDGDDVQLDALVGVFADKNAADAVAVAPALTLKGADIANYTLAQPAGLTANITAKGLTVTGALAQNKVYDGSTDAVVSDAVLVGVVGEEDVTLDALTAAFADKNAGDAVAVVPAFTLKGAAVANYTLAQPAGLTANITAKELTVTGAVAQNKVYDGNAGAVIAEALLDGKVGDDDVALDALTGTFADVNAADAVAVAPALTLKGAAKANYTLAQPTGLSANITKAALTVTAQDATRREGIANEAFVVEYSGFVNSQDKSVLDTQPVAASVADASSAPGDYAITVSGGVDNNYSFTYVGATLTVTSTVGIAQNSIVKINVYPNPFVNELFIEAENLPANAVANLYDLNGRKLMNIKLDGQAISLAHLTSGVYLLQVEGKSFRVVKQ